MANESLLYVIMRYFILTISVLLSFFSSPLQAQIINAEGCNFEIISEHERTVCLIRGTERLQEDGRTEAVIPSCVTYQGREYRVIEIGEGAFIYHSSIVVSLPNTIKRVHDRAFQYCYDIVEINLSDGLESIGDYAFSGCNKIREIYIPASVRYLGKAPFLDADTVHITVDVANPYYDSREKCNAIIETATNTLIQGSAYTHIPSSVTSIGTHAFAYCINLHQIDLPVSITSIGDSTFMYCQGLRELNLPEGLRSIGDGAFMLCNQLKELRIPRNVEHIGRLGIYSGNVDIELKVDSGNPYYDTREDCHAIIDSRTNCLIQGCNATTHIPTSVRSIGPFAFGGCRAFIKLNLHEGITEIGDGSFEGVPLIEVTLPQSLKRIGERAFYYAEFKELMLPNHLEDIGHFAFVCCMNLERIKIPESVTSFGDAIFMSCVSLKEANLPSWLTKVGRDMFKYCKSLKTIIIPKGVTQIDWNAFYQCESLDSITILAPVPPEVNDYGLVPWHRYGVTILVVPEGCTEAYKNHEEWGKFKNIVECNLTAIPSFQKDNSKSSYRQCYDLTGRRLAAPPSKGVYIEGGKLHVNKLTR